MNGPVTGLSLRMPPTNIQAEQALLGALLANNKAYDQMSGFLRPEHFADPIHGRIYEVAARRIDSGRLVDAVALKGEFEHDGVLDEVGGVAYLAQLLAAMVGIINAGEYARAVRDCWHRREMIAIGEDLIARSFAPGESPAGEIHEAAEEALAALADGQEGEAAPVPAHEAMRQAITAAWEARDVPGGLVGLSTGLRDLDDITGGLRAGEMIVIGARPSMGKSTLALAIATGAAQAGGRVLFVTMEMSAADLGAQMAAGLTPISRDLTTRGKLRYQDEATGQFRWRPVQQWEIDAMVAAQRAMADRRLLLLELRMRTIQALRGQVRRMKRRGGLDLVVVDYLGLMTVPELARAGNRTMEVGRLSAGLKGMAQDFGLPVVVLSQLSRAGERREVKRPVLDDLRESGDIEQDADVVILLHRDEYYLHRKKIERGEKDSGEDWANRQSHHNEAVKAAAGQASLYIDKNRKGRIGEVRLAFGNDTTWFGDLPEGGG
ncbi:DnaB-like helicase C-terminal domain-containing protein [Sandarakinorhabdus sp.]|uniref:DnaB-like helicase C-terminal domain-containing protein n=1 Tax=Sandarakinorhabdus sp. TaxID=1916663 RepID=UPI003561D3BE